MRLRSGVPRRRSNCSFPANLLPWPRRNSSSESRGNFPLSFLCNIVAYALVISLVRSVFSGVGLGQTAKGRLQRVVFARREYRTQTAGICHDLHK